MGKQDLINAYYDHYNHQILDPLYEQFQQWKAGELTHEDIDQAIHKVHKENQRLFTFFSRSRKDLVQMIQWNEAWFAAWVADHPSPPGVEIRPGFGEPYMEIDEPPSS